MSGTSHNVSWHKIFLFDTPMLQLSGPSGLPDCALEAVEIRLWEIYILRSRTNLQNTLVTYSLDGRPIPSHPLDSDRVRYRFTLFDWERTIRPLLSFQSVPFELMKSLKIETLANHKAKVYLVDDELDTLFSMNKMLEKAGYDVLLSHVGVKLMEDDLPTPDVFILDKHMPDVDGFQICRHLRSRIQTKDIPIIMISASRGICNEAMNVGANEFIEKPFEVRILLDLVSKYTRRGFVDPSHNVTFEHHC